jgi:hypothetical protein
LTVSKAETVLPQNVALMETVVGAATGYVVTGAHADPLPAVTTVMAGTDATPGLELDRSMGVSTGTPPVKAIMLHGSTVPPVTLAGSRAMNCRVGDPGLGLTVSDAETVLPENVAEIVTTVGIETA